MQQRLILTYNIEENQEVTYKMIDKDIKKEIEESRIEALYQWLNVKTRDVGNAKFMYFLMVSTFLFSSFFYLIDSVFMFTGQLDNYEIPILILMLITCFSMMFLLYVWNRDKELIDEIKSEIKIRIK